MARRKIAGSRAIVTGASSGIGREIARQMAGKGARVVITARREDRLGELSEEIRAMDGEVHSVTGDITDPALREQLIETAKSRLGGLDILVNNAAMTRIGPFDEADAEHLRRIMEVNFFAPVETIRVALPILREGNRPIIANISSVLGHRAVPKKHEYCASKFAMHGFSDSLRCELAPQGIDVLLVSPATTRTEIFDKAIGDKQDLPWLSLGSSSAQSVACKSIRAIRRGRHEVIFTLGGKLLVCFDRLCPPIVNRLVARFA